MRHLTAITHNMRTLRYSNRPMYRVQSPFPWTRRCTNLFRDRHRRTLPIFTHLLLRMASVFIRCPKSSQMEQHIFRLMAGATILVLIPLECIRNHPYKVLSCHSMHRGHSLWHRFLRLHRHNSRHSRHL
jgi:hypothetical protein